MHRLRRRYLPTEHGRIQLRHMFCWDIPFLARANFKPVQQLRDREVLTRLCVELHELRCRYLRGIDGVLYLPQLRRGCSPRGYWGDSVRVLRRR